MFAVSDVLAETECDMSRNSGSIEPLKLSCRTQHTLHTIHTTHSPLWNLTHTTHPKTTTHTTLNTIVDLQRPQTPPTPTSAPYHPSPHISSLQRLTCPKHPAHISESCTHQNKLNPANNTDTNFDFPLTGEPLTMCLVIWNTTMKPIIAV